LLLSVPRNNAFSHTCTACAVEGLKRQPMPASGECFDVNSPQPLIRCCK